MSLRARLTITAVVLVAAGLLAANLATYRYLSSFLLRRVDEQLVLARPFAAEALLPGGTFFGEGPAELLIPPGTYAEYRNASGDVLRSTSFGFERLPTPDLPAVLPLTPPRSLESVLTVDASDGGRFRYRVLATGLRRIGGTLVVAIPLTEVDHTLKRLVFGEVVVSLVVLGVVAALALWLVRVGLRPLSGIGHTAGAIAAGDLSRRVEPANDRTEVGRLGLALNAMLAQIETAFEERRASEERLRRFVADASHELRTPLTSIRGYAELFHRGAKSRPKDLGKTMQRIEAESARMGVLVDDLLLLARLDQGRPLEREDVDLSRVVTEAVESARAIDPDRPIEIVADVPAHVLGDEARLRQVLDNLLDNVRVHTSAGTPVRVAVESAADEVVLSVTDEGPGLSAEVADRAFERFYRGDPARSRETGGAGLGLSIVSAIVEAHGGSVSAAPGPEGSGTRIEVRLPALPEGQIT
jgi:two-component system OmpR family sensor kinase